MDKSTLIMMHALAAYSNFNNIAYKGGGQSKPTQSRPCINCGTPKSHNNAYCSAQCSKDHKSKERKC